MALPKLDIPTYTLELPSNREEIKYRPFLVKEQKTLIILQESENKKDIMDGLQELVANCTFGKLNTLNMTIFDFEYVFLKIRCKSVGETSELSLLCPDDDETRVNTTINLDEVDVQVNDEHTDTIQITDEISMVLRWPTVRDISELELDSGSLVDNVLSLFNRCVSKIIEGDTIHNRIDMSNTDLEEFVDSLPTATFEKVGEFFDTMPQLLHIVNVVNPKTKVESEIEIQGLENFFG